MLPSMTAGRRREVDRLADQAKSAIDSVRRQARGMSTAEAQKCLGDALRARGVPVSESFTAHLARSMADPWWPLKHPVVLWNEFQEARRDHGRDDVHASTGDPELDWLETRLQKVHQLRRIWAPGSVADDRVFVVTIDPWSERVARRVRGLAAPLQVTVRPLS